MVKRRFLSLFKPLLITLTKAFAAILLYELFGIAREYFQYPPVTLPELLTGTAAALLTIALLCWLWSWGEWWWSKLGRVRGFWRELGRCSRDYWKPEPVKTNKV